MVRTEIKETAFALLNYQTKDEQARSLGISRQALYKRLAKHPEISDIVETASELSLTILRVASVKASDNLVRLIDHGNPNISLKASTEILDRIGLVSRLEDKTPTKLKVEIIESDLPDIVKNKYSRSH